MALDDQVRDAICIFYLVLRGLDTIEDDMSVPLDDKLPELAAFYEKLEQPGVPFTAGYLVCGPQGHTGPQSGLFGSTLTVPSN